MISEEGLYAAVDSRCCQQIRKAISQFEREFARCKPSAGYGYNRPGIQFRPAISYRLPSTDFKLRKIIFVDDPFWTRHNDFTGSDLLMKQSCRRRFFRLGLRVLEWVMVLRNRPSPSPSKSLASITAQLSLQAEINCRDPHPLDTSSEHREFLLFQKHFDKFVII